MKCVAVAPLQVIAAAGWISMMSGGALAAVITCSISPANLIIADGQTLNLTASCDSGELSAINWLMDGSVVATDSALNSVQGSPYLYSYLAPIALGDPAVAQYFTFTAQGTPALAGNTVSFSNSSRVTVKPAGAVIAKAAGISSPTTVTAGACGSADGGYFSSKPATNQMCQAGSKPATVVSGPNYYTWTCQSLTGGAEASCYANKGAAFTVSLNIGANGSASMYPTNGQVGAGQTVSVTAQPNANYNASFTGCPGSQSGNVFTAGPLSSNCTVSVAFSTQPVAVNGSCGTSSDLTNLAAAPTTGLCSTGAASGISTTTSQYSWSCQGANGGSTASCSATRAVTSTPSTNTSASASDLGKGYWAPSNTTRRLIADQSGPTGGYTTFAPGCMNGEAPGPSNTGCALNAKNSGLANGLTEGFSFGSGNTLGFRLQSKPGAGAKLAWVSFSSGDGGNVGQSVKFWLTDDPTASYEATPASCRIESVRMPNLVTGGAYCPIVGNKRYYIFIRTDAVAPNPPTWRYKMDTRNSEFELAN